MMFSRIVVHQNVERLKFLVEEKAKQATEKVEKRHVNDGS